MTHATLLHIVLAATLVLSNVACACASGVATSEQSDVEQSAQHHLAGDHASAEMSCAHQDCEGCDTLQDVCPSPDSSAVSSERDSRVTSLADTDDDGNAPDVVYAAVDPPRRTLAAQFVPDHASSPAALWSDTPVHRKDQLIE